MTEIRERIVEIAENLSEAQRSTVLAAKWYDEDGAWHLAGWYCRADKRVRYALAVKNVTRDYLRHANRLTPLGLAVRNHLKKDSQ